MTYRITVVINGKTQEIARNVSDEELGEILEYLIRRPELKDEVRYMIKKEEE